MRVGGSAIFFEPENETELVALLHEYSSANKPFFLLGKGTNVIVRDGGYPGVIVSTLKALCGLVVTNDFQSNESSEARVLKCGAGEPLAHVCRIAASHGLTGLEELSGIPGTIGGAIYMNAGAYG